MTVKNRLVRSATMVAAANQGRPTEEYIKIHQDLAAGGVGLIITGFMIPTLYHIPNYRYTGRRMYTNRPPCGAMRGHGVPQPRFAFESLLDELAEQIGMDPIDLRMANAMDPNTTTVNDLDVLSCEFKATLDDVRETSRWDEKRGKLPFGKGIGVGCGGFVSGAGYPIDKSPHFYTDPDTGENHNVEMDTERAAKKLSEERQEELRENLEDAANDLQRQMEDFERDNAGNLETLDKMEMIQELLQDLKDDESLQDALDEFQELARSAGEIDLVVGTHALIQESISFRQLGLAVIDEEGQEGERPGSSISAAIVIEPRAQLLGHVVGWPIARGGSQSIADAMITGPVNPCSSVRFST